MQELQSIGDVWAADTDPPGNYIHVPLEADVPTFAKQLLEREAQRFDARLVPVQTEQERVESVGRDWRPRKLNDGDAIDLGQLAVLAYAADWQWRSRATICAFRKWAEGFNEAHAGRLEEF